MSKELAERLEQLAVHLKGTVYLHPEHVTALDEAIAALRAEPVALVNAHLEVEWLEKITVMPGLKLYAAPSRETATEVPVHSKSQYKRVAAQGGNPVLSRETDQRSQNLDEMPLAKAVRLARGHQGPPASPITFASSAPDHPTAGPALSAEHVTPEEIATWMADGGPSERMHAWQFRQIVGRMALSYLTARDEVEKMRRRVEMYRDKARGNHEAYLKLYADFVGIEGVGHD